MEAFVRVVDTRSFSSAARQLRVGQPAISKAIMQLEERLGVRLLLRSTHGLTATEAGRNYYEHAKRAVEEAAEADRSARGAGAALSGRLRVCAAVTFARLHIVPRLASFLAEHPAVDVEIVLDDRNVDLIESGIDIALRMGDLTDSSLTARKLGNSRRIVLGTPAYFARFGEPREPKDLLEHESIIYDQRGGGVVWPFRRNDEEQEITLKGRLRMSAAEGVRAAVFADLGIAIASEWMFAPELASGVVIPVLQAWSLPAIDLWAVFPTGRRASAKARAFVQFLERHLVALEAASAHSVSE
jgi:DNA-binding transcriptional LysR family regulator